MSRTIPWPVVYKYTARIDDQVIIPMPEGAQVVEVGHQGLANELVVWAIVRPDAPLVDRVFEVRGTGHPLGEVGRHIGSYSAGVLVWHVFEGAA